MSSFTTAVVTIGVVHVVVVIMQLKLLFVVVDRGNVILTETY